MAKNNNFDLYNLPPHIFSKMMADLNEEFRDLGVNKIFSIINKAFHETGNKKLLEKLEELEV